MTVTEQIEALAAQRAVQIAAFTADRSNRVLLELGARVRDDLVCENQAGTSVDWRAGVVSGRAWNAAARAGRRHDLT